MKFLKFLFYVLSNDRGNLPDEDPIQDPNNKPAPKPTKTIPRRGSQEPLRSKPVTPRGGGGLFDKFQSQQGRVSSQEKTANEMESAVLFNLGLDKFTQENENCLPPDVKGIIELAKKENYSSQREKSRAIKSAIVQSFFSEQSNMELLTPSQKNMIDGFMKLTKNGREAKANSLYSNVFEPALNAKKLTMKAEELGKKAGQRGTSSKEDAMRIKLHSLGLKGRGIREE